MYLKSSAFNRVGTAHKYAWHYLFCPKGFLQFRVRDSAICVHAGYGSGYRRDVNTSHCQRPALLADPCLNLNTLC